MALPKPPSAKAPAPVLDQSIFQRAVADPCCIPESVPPLLANGEAMNTQGHDATHHIMEPTKH